MLLLLALAASSPAGGTEGSGYYRLDGDSLAYVDGGDRDAVEASEWQVRLYRNGDKPTGRGYWGLITGKSAAKVLADLQSNQEFQIRFAKFAGFDYRTESLTYFNQLGPIAVSKRGRQQSTMWLLGDKLRELYSLYRTLASKKPSPYRGVGTSLREYGRVLSDATTKLRQLERSLAETEMTGNEIGSALADVVGELDTASQQAARFGSAPSREPPGAFRITRCCGGYKVEEGEYVKGKKHGRFIEYGLTAAGGAAISQAKKGEGDYRNGLKSGHWVEQCGGGLAKGCVEEGSYENGERIGSWAQHHCSIERNRCKDEAFRDQPLPERWRDFIDQEGTFVGGSPEPGNDAY